MKRILEFIYTWTVTIVAIILCAEIVVITAIGILVFDEEKVRAWGLRTLYALAWQAWHMGVITDDQLEEVKRKCLACQKCELAKTRTQVVFSGGIPNPKLMLIGEAPGFYEDKQGKPFVGKAGQLLDKIFASCSHEFISSFSRYSKSIFFKAYFFF